MEEERALVVFAVCNKTKRKTKNEMAGRRVQGFEKDGGERMERQSKETRNLEAYFIGGQGPPRAVAPSKKKKNIYSRACLETADKLVIRDL
jgi:hypothetical protein